MATDFAVHKDDTFDSLSALVGITVPYRPVASTPPQQGGLIVDSTSNSLYYSDGSTWIVVQGSVTSVCPVEVGINATAADAFATAVGCNAVAESNGTAVGASAISHIYSVASGSGALAGQYAVGIGYATISSDASVTVGAQSLALAGISIGLEATSNVGVSVGFSSNASNQSIAIGTSTSANGNSLAIGYSANALGANSVALGFDANATSNSIAIGRSAAASFTANTIAIGYLASAQEVGDVSVGANAFTHGGIAVGESSQAENTGVAIGVQATCVYSNSVALGHNATVTVADQLALPSTYTIPNTSSPDSGNTVSFVRATSGGSTTAIPMFLNPLLMQGTSYHPLVTGGGAAATAAFYVSLGQCTIVFIYLSITNPSVTQTFISVPPGTTHAPYFSTGFPVVGLVTTDNKANTTNVSIGGFNDVTTNYLLFNVVVTTNMGAYIAACYQY